MRIAREGYPFISVAVLLGLLSLVLGWVWLALFFALAALGFFFFFRDPERSAPEGEDLVIAPADGKVLSIASGEKGPWEAPAIRVSIFLSPFDVHINRAPVRGKVEDVRYQQGTFFAAYRDQASHSNERNLLKIVDATGRRLGLVQIAGVLARRIVCYVRKGDSLEAGQRLGLIMFGSRVDLYVPAGCRIDVAEGQRVKGGQTVIGRFA